jgi:hypothetical protein
VSWRISGRNGGVDFALELVESFGMAGTVKVSRGAHRAAAPAAAARSVSAARAVLASRSARERAELAMTPAERLTLALELSDLCAELAEAGRRAAPVKR